MVEAGGIPKTLLPFRYRPLPPGPFVRIVSLQPDTDRVAPLRCTLTTAKLTQGIKFAALSYCWGTSSRSQLVDCDGQRLLVTPNCESALRQLRRPHHPRLLWIDSISIDQTSNDERGHQVALMGDIYKTATDVIVWLGESDDETDEAFQHLLTLGQAWAAMNSGKDDKAASPKYHLSDSSMKAYSTIFSKPYFSRLWTVQEVTLPDPHNIIAYCGTSSYPWVYLLNAAAYLRVRTKFGGRWDDATRLQRCLSGRLILARAQATGADISSVLGGYAPLHNEMSPQTVLFILNTAREKQATKPEDRIFSLYSVLKELGTELPLPDYNKSIEQIYTEAAVVCMRNDSSLDILLHGLSDQRRPSLPSWVPDWSSPNWSSPGWHLSDPRRDILEPNFRAAGNSMPMWYLDGDSRMVTQAVILDTVFAGGPPLQYNDSTSRRIQTQYLPTSPATISDLTYDLTECVGVVTHWIKLANTRAVYPSSRARMSAFLRMIFYSGLDSNAKAEELDSFMRWWDILYEQDLTHETPLPLLRKKMIEWTYAMELHVRLRRLAPLQCARNKSFFTTERGLYGIAVKTVRKGDKVALLAGVRVPLILRKDDEGDGYHYVGYAAVDAFMYGGGWRIERTERIVLI